MAAESQTTVVLPCGDTVEFLVDAVQSCLDQSLSPASIVIVDDATKPSSHEAIERAGALDRRIQVAANRGAGLVAALNTGLGLVGTRYVARMDADDINLPHRFEDQEAVLADMPHVVAVGGLVHYVSHDGTPLPEIPWIKRGFPLTALEVSRTLAESNSVFHPTAMMRTTAVAAVGGYRDTYTHIEDYDLWIRLLSLGDIVNIPDHVLLYRRHADQVGERHGSTQAQLVTRLHADIDQQVNRRRDFAGWPVPRSFAIRGDLAAERTCALVHELARITAHPAYVCVMPDRSWNREERRSVHLAASFREVLAVTVLADKEAADRASLVEWARSLPEGCDLVAVSVHAPSRIDVESFARDIVNASPASDHTAVRSPSRGGRLARLLERMRPARSVRPALEVAVHRTPEDWLGSTATIP